MDGRKIHNQLMLVNGFNGIIDIISKYMMSFPVTNNDSENCINCLKEFCKLKGFPKILQTDNGVEYKNNKFKAFSKIIIYSIYLAHTIIHR